MTKVLVFAVVLIVLSLVAGIGHAQMFGKFMAHLPAKTGCASVCLVLRII